MKNFAQLIALARRNATENEWVTNMSTEEAVQQYLNGLHDEVVEVQAEARENNSVHLEDELSDIAWDYAALLAICEDRGLITSAESVFAHASKKYSERQPAFLAADHDLWKGIKDTQKAELKKRHKERYGE